MTVIPDSFYGRCIASTAAFLVALVMSASLSTQVFATTEFDKHFKEGSKYYSDDKYEKASDSSGR